MKKMLMIASVPSMIGQFNMANIKILQEQGYKVDVACNYSDRSVWTDEKVSAFRNELKKLNINQIQVEFSRSPLDFGKHIKSYHQVLDLLKKNNYEFVHCHTPICAAIVRLAAHKTNTQVIYTAHGFHFYKGAPIKNWLIFYPIEKYLSKYTDVLITINKEDYHRAKAKFKAKKVEYIPGVGVDLEKFKPQNDFDKDKLKLELGIPVDAKVILSVGELNKNKNHQVVIKALDQLKDKNIHYVIAGKGELKSELEKLAKEYKLEHQLHLLGFRTDIKELYQIADIYIHMSIREGLGLAPLEAMAMNLPLITSKATGIRDYMVKGITGFMNDFNDDIGIAKSMEQLLNDKDLSEKISQKNQVVVKKFSMENSKNKMKEIYFSI